jgi:hypothetical protein
MRNKKSIAIICGTVLAAITSIVLGMNKTNRLSESEISNLRKQYPVCGTDDMGSLAVQISETLEEKLARNNIYSFVYGEVAGDRETYFYNLATGDEVLESKLSGTGLSVYEYYEYPILVLEDTEGYHAKGEMITIAGNMMFKDSKPELTNGMKIVVPLVENYDKESRNYFTEVGMYYVTDDEYVLSAYDEESLSNTAYTGLKVQALLKELGKLIE